MHMSAYVNDNTFDSTILHVSALCRTDRAYPAYIETQFNSLYIYIQDRRYSKRLHIITSKQRSQYKRNSRVRKSRSASSVL